MKVSVIIPIYNEERSIAAVLDQILELRLEHHELEVIVSNDGSSDRTAEVVAPYVESDFRVRSVISDSNRGKGHAIRRGLELASGEIVLIQDADTEYSPTDYPRLLAPFTDRSAQAVYGSRFLDRRWPLGMLPQNWIANRVFTLVAKVLYGGRITDEGTGFKAFRRDILRSMALESRRFEFCPEVTAKLLRRGIEICEVPVSYHARARHEGKKPGVRDGLHVLWTLIRLRF
jgi:glycosyltransferase involved in cell wall biosynthesis